MANPSNNVIGNTNIKKAMVLRMKRRLACIGGFDQMYKSENYRHLSGIKKWESNHYVFVSAGERDLNQVPVGLGRDQFKVFPKAQGFPVFSCLFYFYCMSNIVFGEIFKKKFLGDSRILLGLLP